MKRRILLLAAASTMSITSLVGFTAATTAPAAAATNPFTAIGYIIQCITPQHLINDFGQCLVNAIENLVASLGLPVFPTSANANAKTAPKLPTLPGSNAPSLNLPTNVTSMLKTLPPALQTTPVASQPTVNAPIRNLVPSLSAPRAGVASLPKLPTITPINFLNVADTKAPSSSPVSANDILVLASLGLLGASGVVVRRRAMARA
jgi:hypothetical protein